MEERLDLGFEIEEDAFCLIGFPFVINPKEHASDFLFSCVGVATIKLLKSSSFMFPPDDDELELFLPCNASPGTPAINDDLLLVDAKFLNNKKTIITLLFSINLSNNIMSSSNYNSR